VPKHAKRDRNILVSIRRPAEQRRGDPCSTMHLLSPDDRPREKLWRHGAAALGDNELVALVLGTGAGGGGALHVANVILATRGGLHGLMRSSLDEMAQVAGIGRARVAQLAAALELGRRTLAQAPRARVRIRTPHDAAAFLMPTYGARSAEVFGLVLLDSQHRVLKTTLLTLGTLNSTIVEPRDVFRQALLGSAAAVVVFHTHPSGDPMPSEEDDALTRRLVAVGTLMGVPIVDHIIIGDVRYCSFREMGRL
jgi:DNA repair protein RadC